MVKKYAKRIPADKAYKLIVTKEDCEKSNKQIKSHNHLQSVLPFYEDLPDTLFTPKEYIYKTKKVYQNYFCFLATHLKDANPDNFKNKNNGLYSECPIIREAPVPQFMEQFTPDISPKDMYQKIDQKMKKNLENFKGNFIFLEAPWKEIYVLANYT